MAPLVRRAASRRAERTLVVTSASAANEQAAALPIQTGSQQAAPPIQSKKAVIESPKPSQAPCRMLHKGTLETETALRTVLLSAVRVLGRLGGATRAEIRDLLELRHGPLPGTTHGQRLSQQFTSMQPSQSIVAALLQVKAARRSSSPVAAVKPGLESLSWATLLDASTSLQVLRSSHRLLGPDRGQALLRAPQRQQALQAQDLQSRLQAFLTPEALSVEKLDTIALLCQELLALNAMVLEAVSSLQGEKGVAQCNIHAYLCHKHGQRFLRWLKSKSVAGLERYCLQKMVKDGWLSRHDLGAGQYQNLVRYCALKPPEDVKRATEYLKRLADEMEGSNDAPCKRNKQDLGGSITRSDLSVQRHMAVLQDV